MSNNVSENFTALQSNSLFWQSFLVTQNSDAYHAAAFCQIKHTDIFYLQADAEDGEDGEKS